jgi:FKBP-type peptidyl-prolyl cis-trans isomerase FkpA
VSCINSRLRTKEVFMRLILIVTATVALAACSEPESVADSEEGAADAFETDDQRVLYTIGTRLGLNIEELRLTDEEIEFVSAGMRDEIRGEDYQVDINVYGPLMQEFVNRRIAEGLEAAQAEMEAERVAAAEFADSIAAEPGAERSASGLVYVPLSEGQGEMPDPRDRVLVHYHGTLRDGTVFDSSRDRDMPVPFALNEVIPCWTEGVAKMRVGGTAKLLCPSDIAYGDGGIPGSIPGGAALLFEVELLEIL